MTDYKWFRCYSEIVRDPKIRRLQPAERWVWIGLLALANEADERGRLMIADGVPYEVLDLADALGVMCEDIETTLSKAQKLKMLVIEPDGAIVILNFEKRQYDNPSDAPGKTRERKRQQREKDTSLNSSHTHVTSMSRPSHEYVTTYTTDTDTESTTCAHEQKSDGETEPTTEDVAVVVELLTAFGVVGNSVDKVLKLHPTPEVVKACIEHIRGSNGAINNPAGMLVSMIKSGKPPPVAKPKPQKPRAKPDYSALEDF